MVLRSKLHDPSAASLTGRFGTFRPSSTWCVQCALLSFGHLETSHGVTASAERERGRGLTGAKVIGVMSPSHAEYLEGPTTDRGRRRPTQRRRERRSTGAAGSPVSTRSVGCDPARPGWPARTTNGHRRPPALPLRLPRRRATQDATSSAPSTSTPAQQRVAPRQGHLRARAPHRAWTRGHRVAIRARQPSAKTPGVGAYDDYIRARTRGLHPYATAPHHSLPLHAALIVERQSALPRNGRRRPGAICEPCRSDVTALGAVGVAGRAFAGALTRRTVRRTGKRSSATLGSPWRSGSATQSTAGSCWSSQAAVGTS